MVSGQNDDGSELKEEQRTGLMLGKTAEADQCWNDHEPAPKTDQAPSGTTSKSDARVHERVGH